MKLINLPSAEIYFPNPDWKCLRPALKENFFYWGSEVKTGNGASIFAWAFNGGSPKSHPQNINILILDSDFSELEAFYNWVKTAFSVEPPHETEWVAVLKTLHTYFNTNLAATPLHDSLSVALRASNLEPHLGVLAGREKFYFLNDDEMNFLYAKKWDPSTFELIETMNDEVRKTLLNVLKTVRVSGALTAQNTKEVIHHVLILTRKIGIKPSLTLLERMGEKTVHAEELRLSLFKMAQPELYLMSQSRIDKLRALKAPPRTAIHGDPTFETDIVKITHNPKTLRDFEVFKNWIDSPDLIEKFRELFDGVKRC